MCFIFWVPEITFTHHIKRGHVGLAGANWLLVHIQYLACYLATIGGKGRGWRSRREQARCAVDRNTEPSLQPLMKHITGGPTVLNAIDWNVEYI